MDGVGLALLADISDGVTRGFTSSSFYTALDSLQTALSVAGRGALNYIRVHNPTANTVSSGEIYVSIDGSPFQFNITNFNTGHSLLPLPGWPLTELCDVANLAAIDDHHISPLFSLEFKTSLLIKLKSDGVNNLRVYWGISI